MGLPEHYFTAGVGEWLRSEKYQNERLVGPPDAALAHALQNSSENGLPEIAVGEGQGKLMQLLARSIQATRILEVGTLGGYSTIWLARGLPPNGHLTTLEISEKNAEVARENIAFAGLDSKVQILVGPAAETLPTLQADPPYDFAFIDADKDSSLEYFMHAKRLVRPGGVIIVDNVVRYGRVADPDFTDPSIEGVRRLLEYVKDDRTVDASALATVGDKGFDGFMYAIRL